MLHGMWMRMWHFPGLWSCRLGPRGARKWACKQVAAKISDFMRAWPGLSAHRLRRDLGTLHALSGIEFTPRGIGDVDRRERIARHIFAGAGFGAQIAVEPGDLAGQKRGARQPGAGE